MTAFLPLPVRILLLRYNAKQETKIDTRRVARFQEMQSAILNDVTWTFIQNL